MPPATGDRDPASALAPIRERASAAALLFDVDGTLAPIVERPEDASVPAGTAEALTALSEGYALVGCVSGRPATEARELVGAAGLTYVGNHGLELLRAGAEKPEAPPGVEIEPNTAERLRDRLDPEELDAAGVRLEDKGPIVALHWRGASDARRADAFAEAAAKEALELGLKPHRGRMVLELRPDVGVDKGTAIISLLEAGALTACLYAGDDATDIDAFRHLGELREAGGLEALIRVGVASPESPPQIAELCDLRVDDPEGVRAVINQLAS